jgi:hypothetical protein
MKNQKLAWSKITYLSAFVIGAILFWFFGKAWLDLSSVSIFLAGILGVGTAVLGFGAWTIIHNSHHKDN